MIGFPISAQTLAKAQRRREELDRERGEGSTRAKLFPGARWVGYLGETAIRRWLQVAVPPGVQCRMNGGWDSLPDLVVGGRSVAIKTHRYRTSIRPDHHVCVAEQFTQADEALFAVVEETARPRVVVVGGIAMDRLLAEGQHLRIGDSFVSGAAVRNPCHDIAISALDPPKAWLARLQ